MVRFRPPLLHLWLLPLALLLPGVVLVVLGVRLDEAGALARASTLLLPWDLDPRAPAFGPLLGDSAYGRLIAEAEAREFAAGFTWAGVVNANGGGRGLADEQDHDRRRVPEPHQPAAFLGDEALSATGLLRRSILRA
jgi:hypothetical protein